MCISMIVLKQPQKHPKGDIPAGAIYNWSDEYNGYVYKVDGQVISLVSEALVGLRPDVYDKV